MNYKYASLRVISYEDLLQEIEKNVVTATVWTLKETEKNIKTINLKYEIIRQWSDTMELRKQVIETSSP